MTTRFLAEHVLPLLQRLGGDSRRWLTQRYIVHARGIVLIGIFFY